VVRTILKEGESTMQARTLVVACGLVGLLAASARAADNYQVDPVHAAVVFRVKHLGVGYTYGRLNEVGGRLVLDEEDPANCVFEVQAEADSVDTGNAKRDQHLKGPDFFNAKEFPAVTFRSKQVKKADASTYEVAGELTLHGVTKPVTVKLQRVGTGKDPWGGYRTGFEGSLTVKRSDFGMKFMPEGVGDEVWLLIGFEALRQ